jgi:hypothetical protein
MVMALRFYFTALILTIGIGVFCQGLINPEWSIIKSSPQLNGNAEAWAIGTDGDGNIYWGVNQDMPGVWEYMDALVYKLSPDTQVMWIDTAITGQWAQQSYHLKVTDSLDYVGGRTCNSLGTELCDVLFFTTDSQTGETGWEFIWDAGFGYEEIDGISLEDDGIIMTGWSAGDTTEVDVLIMKLDYDGQLIWETTWGHPDNRDDHQDGHIVVDDDYIFLSGLYDGSPLLGWDGQALLAKIDKSTGEFVDTHTYGSDDIWFNAENALGMTTDGTYLYVTGYTTPAANDWDLFIAKFDKDLNEIWYETWGGSPEAETARAIAIGPDGLIYIGANTKNYGEGEQDVALLVYDTDGNFIEFNTWGAELDDHVLDIYIDGDIIYLTGKTQSFHPNQLWEAFLLKTHLSTVTSSGEAADFNNVMNVFPNPAGSEFEIVLGHSKAGPREVTVVDLAGKVVRREAFESEERLTIDSGGMKAGLYFLWVFDGHGRSYSEKVVVGVGR